MIQQIEDKYKEYAMKSIPIKTIDKRPLGRNKGASMDPKVSIENKNLNKHDKQSVPIYNSRAKRKFSSIAKGGVGKNTELSIYARDLSSRENVDESSLGQVEVLNSGRRKNITRFRQVNLKESSFNYKRPLKSNALLPTDFQHKPKIGNLKSDKIPVLRKKIPAQEILAASEEMNRFDHNYTESKPSKINENISPRDHNSDLEESKTNIDEESKRFNNDYFKMFAEDQLNNEQSKDKLENDYEPDFEEIEEEIFSNDNQEDERYSENFSQTSHKNKRKSTMGGHIFPKEFEENPYLYYAKKAQKKMKAMTSLKNQSGSKGGAKFESGKSIMNGSNRPNRMSTEQDDSEYIPTNHAKVALKYRPFSPPFAQITSEPSELDELMDANFKVETYQMN